eukprot:contig_9360_g2242
MQKGGGTRTNPISTRASLSKEKQIVHILPKPISGISQGKKIDSSVVATYATPSSARTHTQKSVVGQRTTLVLVVLERSGGSRVLGAKALLIVAAVGLRAPKRRLVVLGLRQRVGGHLLRAEGSVEGRHAHLLGLALHGAVRAAGEHAVRRRRLQHLVLHLGRNVVLLDRLGGRVAHALAQRLALAHNVRSRRLRVVHQHLLLGVAPVRDLDGRRAHRVEVPVLLARGLLQVPEGSGLGGNALVVGHARDRALRALHVVHTTSRSSLLVLLRDRLGQILIALGRNLRIAATLGREPAADLADAGGEQHRRASGGGRRRRRGRRGGRHKGALLGIIDGHTGGPDGHGRHEGHGGVVAGKMEDKGWKSGDAGKALGLRVCGRRGRRRSRGAKFGSAGRREGSLLWWSKRTGVTRHTRVAGGGRRSEQNCSRGTGARCPSEMVHWVFWTRLVCGPGLVGSQPGSSLGR